MFGFRAKKTKKKKTRTFRIPTKQQAKQTQLSKISETNTERKKNYQKKTQCPNFPRSHFISLTFSATKHRGKKKTKGEHKNLPQILTPTALRIGGF